MKIRIYTNGDLYEKLVARDIAKTISEEYEYQADIIDLVVDVWGSAGPDCSTSPFGEVRNVFLGWFCDRDRTLSHI